MMVSKYKDFKGAKLTFLSIVQRFNEWRRVKFNQPLIRL